MKKVKINLSPKKLTVFDENFNKVLGYLPLLALLVLFFVLVVGLVGAASSVKSRQHNNLKTVWQEWEPRHRELLDIKRGISTSKRHLKNLQNLVVSQNRGVYLLEGLLVALPENIWLESLHFKGDSTELSGYIVSWEEDSLVSLKKFIDNLQKERKFQELFARINIKDTKKINFRGREITQFFLECKK